MSSLCSDDRRHALRRRPNPALALLHRLLALPGLWQARIEARTRLQRLDDATLRDLGLRREQVETMGRKPFWCE